MGLPGGGGSSRGPEWPLPPQSHELKLSDGKVGVIEKSAGREAPYTIRQMGIYLVLDTAAGLVLLWDRRTSIFLRLSPEFKVRRPGPGLGQGRQDRERQTQGQRDRERQRQGGRGGRRPFATCSVRPVAAGTDAHKPRAPGLWSRKPRRGLGGHTPSGALAQGSSCLFQLWGLVAMSPPVPRISRLHLLPSAETLFPHKDTHLGPGSGPEPDFGGPH